MLHGRCSRYAVCALHWQRPGRAVIIVAMMMQKNQPTRFSSGAPACCSNAAPLLYRLAWLINWEATRKHSQQTTEQHLTLT